MPVLLGPAAGYFLRGCLVASAMFLLGWAVAHSDFLDQLGIGWTGSKSGTWLGSRDFLWAWGFLGVMLGMFGWAVLHSSFQFG